VRPGRLPRCLMQHSGDIVLMRPCRKDAPRTTCPIQPVKAPFRAVSFKRSASPPRCRALIWHGPRRMRSTRIEQSDWPRHDHGRMIDMDLIHGLMTPCVWSLGIGPTIRHSTRHCDTPTPPCPKLVTAGCPHPHPNRPSHSHWPKDSLSALRRTQSQRSPTPHLVPKTQSIFRPLATSPTPMTMVHTHDQAGITTDQSLASKGFKPDLPHGSGLAWRHQAPPVQRPSTRR
jgi:hypothetical protein